MRPTVHLFFVLGCLLSLPVQAKPAENTVNILVINAYYQRLPWTLSFNDGVQTAQMSIEDADVTLFFENLDVTRSDQQQSETFRQYLREKYSSIHLDAVIADSAPSSAFLEQMPVFDSLIQIHHALSNRSVVRQQNRLLFSNDQTHFIERTLEIIREQNPDLQRLVVIESGAPPARRVRPVIESYLQRFPDIALEVPSDFRWPELLTRLTDLDKQTAIFYGAMFQDSDGQAFVPRDALKELTEATNVPVYGSYATYLGTGMIGGHLSDPARTGQSMVEAVMDYLRFGEFAGFYPTSQSYIDATAARRFRLDTSLSTPVILLNEPERWYQRNDRVLLWVLLVFILVSVLSLYWNSRLKRLVDRLHQTNRMLKDTKKALSISNGELKTLSRQDPLTGLYNRRAMLPMIEDAVSEYQRYELPSTLMLLDLDDFKLINDQLGHNIGDAVLKSVAYVLQSVSRRTDTIARWGGEEFLILAKGIHAEEAFRYLEKVRKQIRESQTIDDRPITFSAGVCEVQANHTADTLIAEADQAMYDAKLNGKDRTCIHRPDEPSVANT
ncbi:sensor domain-containing diguanylate cyclase [Reinekea blandensis]|nr:GGDEF domain-containing protein [Reinekea blandensis]